MDETGIGRAVNIHLQTVPAFSIPGDTSETSRYFSEDIVEPPVVLDADGFIAVPEGPGIGVAVLEDRVARYTLDRERIR
jgi:O-succinylbenzoate synthase